MQRWTQNDMPDQTGKRVLITGANSGLGYESTRALARKGATVIMACRNMDKAEMAADTIRMEVPGADLVVMPLDLGNLASIQRFAADFNARFDHLDILMNNAGVMAVPYQETADGFEMQFGINHLGHFALTGLILDKLIYTPDSRIVTISSGMHHAGRMDFDDLQSRQSYSRYGAYGQSKLANLLFAFELNRRLRKSHARTISLAAHPGYTATNLQGNSSHASGSRLEAITYAITNRIFAQNVSMGILPQLYAATAPDVHGSDFIGPNFMQMRGYPKKVMAADRAYNEDDAARLWQASIELTGVDYSSLNGVLARENAVRNGGLATAS